MASSISKESLRFIFVGLVNTIHHYLWYLFFTEWLSVPYIISHWLAFVISMIGSFYMNTYFTYRTKPSWRKFLQFPATYIVNIVVSTTALYILREWASMNNLVAPILASVFAIPFTFIISRKVLTADHKGGNS